MTTPTLFGIPVVVRDYVPRDETWLVEQMRQSLEPAAHGLRVVESFRLLDIVRDQPKEAS